MADYAVPGVYIEELSGLSLSIVSGATAIPVFAFNADSKLNTAFAKNETYEINSWLEVTTAIAGEIAGKVTAEEETLRNLQADLLYLSLKTYFENGGGRCYLADVAKLDEFVPGFDDITLLVQAGTELSTFKSKVELLLNKAGAIYFVLYDGPNDKALTTDKVEEGAEKYGSTPYAAVYYPWLKVDNVEQDIPPSAAVAGVYCTVDRERGVWKAPANVALKGVTPKFKVSDEVNGKCNVPSGGKAINVIREFRGTGPLIWGARTLQSNQDTWRYVPVRRLFNAAEKDIRSTLSVALFEPNNQPTWERVRGAIENYLHGLWQRGALLGTTPEAAYFVHIGKGVTMTDDDIKKGKMIVKVGMAAVRPAEFIILQMTQDVVPA